MKSKFIALGIFILIVGIFYSYFILGNQLRELRGEKKLEQYVNKMYSDYVIIGRSCQGKDTNNDKYITCNARIKNNADGQERTLSLQCPTFIESYLATSCKEAGILINNNN